MPERQQNKRVSSRQNTTPHADSGSNRNDSSHQTNKDSTQHIPVTSTHAITSDSNKTCCPNCGVVIKVSRLNRHLQQKCPAQNRSEPRQSEPIPQSMIQDKALPSENKDILRLFASFAQDIYVFWLKLVSCHVIHASLGTGMVISVDKNSETGRIYIMVKFDSGVSKFNTDAFINPRYIEDLILPTDLLDKVLELDENRAAFQRKLQQIEKARAKSVSIPQPKITHIYKYYTWDNFPIDECSFCGQWICLKPHKRLSGVLETCDISGEGYSLDRHICDGHKQKLDVLDFCYQGGGVDSNRRRH